MKFNRVAVHPSSDVIPSSAALPKATDFELLEQSQTNLASPLDEIPKSMNADANPNRKSSRASEHAISIYPSVKGSSTHQVGEMGQPIYNINADVEALSEELLDKVKVIASGLQKTYPNGKVAVKNFTLAMVEGQITCLLGMQTFLIIECTSFMSNLPPIIPDRTQRRRQE